MRYLTGNIVALLCLGVAVMHWKEHRQDPAPAAYAASPAVPGDRLVYFAPTTNIERILQAQPNIQIRVKMAAN